MSNQEVWDRDKDGNLIPNEGKIIITDLALKKQIGLQKTKLELTKDEKEEKVLIRVIQLLKEALAEKEEEITIRYTPLIHCELSCLGKNLGCNATPIDDVDADVCATHCIDPKHNYNIWRDMKDPRLKSTIASFIYDKSIPEREVSKKESEAFQMLQGFVSQ